MVEKKGKAVSAGPAKCKVHPDRDAVIRKDGRSMGRCAECMKERGERMRAAAGGKGGKGGKK